MFLFVIQANRNLLTKFGLTREAYNALGPDKKGKMENVMSFAVSNDGGKKTQFGSFIISTLRYLEADLIHLFMPRTEETIRQDKLTIYQNRWDLFPRSHGSETANARPTYLTSIMEANVPGGRNFDRKGSKSIKVQVGIAYANTTDDEKNTDLMTSLSLKQCKEINGDGGLWMRSVFQDEPEDVFVPMCFAFPSDKKALKHILKMGGSSALIEFFLLLLPLYYVWEGFYGAVCLLDL